MRKLNDQLRFRLAGVPRDALFAQALQAPLAAVGSDEQRWLWALSVAHSRSFLLGSAAAHLIVPSIGMANHSAEPNAAMWCISCTERQGWNRRHQCACSAHDQSPPLTYQKSK